MNRCTAMITIGFAIICLQMLSCYSAVTGSGEANAENTSDEELLPCTYKGNIIIDGESRALDDCTTCLCDNSTVVCTIVNCPVISCSDGQEPVEETGECCESCPDPSKEVAIFNENYDCKYINTNLQIGGVHFFDACTRCECRAYHLLDCEIRSCPAVFCGKPITFEGECCGVCPYYSPVWKVQPTEPDAITAGTLNIVEFDLAINISSWGSNAPGDDLVKVSAWAADGNGNRFGYIDQVLTGEQASKDIIRGQYFGGWVHRIDEIAFHLDASDATCSQMEYLCVELAKGDTPAMKDKRLPFTVEGVASEHNHTSVPNNLIGCIPFPTCQDTGTKQQVSFSVAKKSGQIAHEPVAILGWSDEFNNVGGAFDSKTGMFTSYETGSYFFTYQITEIANVQAPQVSLMKNDATVLAGSSNSNNIIVDLEDGDTVWLQLQGELVGTTERFSTFTGFRL